MSIIHVEKMEDSIQRILTRNDKDIIKFLMGDFNTNAFTAKEDYENILNQGLIDTYTVAKEKDNGVTVGGAIAGWQGATEEKRLDYIFSTRPVEVKSSKVIFNGENKPLVSDHYGVEVEIEI